MGYCISLVNTYQLQPESSVAKYADDTSPPPENSTRMRHQISHLQDRREVQKWAFVLCKNLLLAGGGKTCWYALTIWIAAMNVFK